jgi:hypothetical protein
MVNRKTADRIIVKSNARMKMVLDWYYENKHWLDREPFLAPMESGVVELCEEQIEFTFENTRGVVEIAIYPTVQPNIPASIIFDYIPEQMDIANRRVAPELVEPKRLALDLVLRYDKTPEKEARKYHALMLFMAYYREEVKVEQRIERRPAKHKKKKRTAQGRQPLIRRIYTVTDFDSTALVKPEQAKRGYTKPDHEVNVRGHLRRYKSGKVVWVKPSVKYKGKTAHHKEYEL